MLLNCFYEGFKTVDLQLAWERAILNVNTKYLSLFLKELKYIDGRIPDEGQSERLLLRYYNFMWQIRKNLFEQFGLSILPNLEKFPLKIDEVDKDYYELIANAIEKTNLNKRELRKSRFYVHKKTPFFIGTERYYEVTLQLSGSYATKYNRITAYTKENISTSYSVQVGFVDFTINLWGVESKLKVITNWKVSIDPVCLNTLSKIVGLSTRLSSTQTEYFSLMKFLTKTGMSILEFIDLPDDVFYSQLELIYEKKNKDSFMDTIIKIKKNYSKGENNFGRNTVRYLLLNLREEILDAVLPFSSTSNRLCDELYLSSRCIPFEISPFLSNLAGSKTSESHNIKNIMEITSNREIESVYPYLAIKHQIRKTGEIFFEKGNFGDDFEVKLFNSSLDSWEKRQGYEIKERNGFLTIESYESETLYILERLLKMSKMGNKGQKEFNNKYLRESNDDFRDELKKQAIAEAFINSRVLLIYGAAGTGKTTLINYISNMMSSQKKLFLTKTHTAKQNLMRRIENPGAGSDFISLDSFTKKVDLPDYDIIFVDECSIIDNRTMVTFLSKVSENTFVVLAGDIHQIESIDFGNWFLYAKDIISTRGSNVELQNTWRTEDKNLISLWDEVRNRGEFMTVKLVIDGPFSKDIGQDIFSQRGDDEVILCLNYDGKFGLNNMNNYFQNANKQGEPFVWNEWTYKAGDPILFNESKRFNVLYNNLKGKIVDIRKEEECIYFTIDVLTNLTESSCIKNDIIFVSANDETTRIIIRIDAYKEADNEEDRRNNRLRSVIPFQLAYAVSIHKAQGLEYDSVKVVIPSVNSEKITHGIFYTAITRAKNKLKIFWSSETMTEIIKGFQEESDRTKSFDFVKQRLEII